MDKVKVETKKRVIEIPYYTVGSVVRMMRKRFQAFNEKALEYSNDFVEASVENSLEWQKLAKKAINGSKEVLAGTQELALEVAEEAIEVTADRAKDWQTVVNKGVRSTKRIVEDQQSLTFNTLEEVKENVKEISKKTVDLLELDEVAAKAKQVGESVVDFVEEKVESIDLTDEKEAIEKGFKKSVEYVKSTTGIFTDKASELVEDVREAAHNLPTKSTVVKTTNLPTKKTVVKTTTRRVVIEDLTQVEGIGPKIKGLLKAEGITTFKQLGDASISKLNDILEAAGPRFRMHNPETWVSQAKQLAKNA